eukprot:scaffold29519_cov54-Phaeocystis_antarctica.AAC.1
MLCGPIRQTLSDKPYQTNPVRQTQRTEPTRQTRQTDPTAASTRRPVPREGAGGDGLLLTFLLHLAWGGHGAGVVPPLVCVFAWCRYVCARV